MGILMARPLQNRIIATVKMQGYRSAQHALSQGRCALQRQQCHRHRLATPGDLDVIPLQSQFTGGPAKRIGEETVERALLQLTQ